MNKQIVELNLEQIEDVVGGVIVAMSATYSASATMTSQPGVSAPSLGVPGATVLKR
jgi:hypothetical protein